MVNVEFKNTYCGFWMPEYECRKPEILDLIFLTLLPSHPHFPVAMQTNTLSYARMPFYRAFFQPNQGIDLC